MHLQQFLDPKQGSSTEVWSEQQDGLTRTKAARMSLRQSVHHVTHQLQPVLPAQREATLCHCLRTIPSLLVLAGPPVVYN